VNIKKKSTVAKTEPLGEGRPTKPLGMGGILIQKRMEEGIKKRKEVIKKWGVNLPNFPETSKNEGT